MIELVTFIGGIATALFMLVGAYVWGRWGLCGVCAIWNNRASIDAMVTKEAQNG